MTNNDLSYPKIDLNQADVETLATLPGIGAKLAARIVSFRKEVHLFEEPIEITAVPGISERMYRQFAHIVSVSLPEYEAAPQAVQPLSMPPDGGEVTGTEADSIPREPVEPVETRAEKIPEEWPVPELEITPTPPAAPSPEPKEKPRAESLTPGPAPSPQPAQRGCLRQFLLMLVSALAGGLLALLVIQSINGTLDIAAHPRLLQLTDQVSVLEQQDAALNGEIRELRNRLNQVEALSGRLQSAEADIQSLDEALATLEAQVASLEQNASQMQETVNQIRTAADRFDNFLNGLRDLVLATQGTPIPTPTLNLTATASLTPAATPETVSTVEATPTTNTPTVQPTATATRTARSTPTPTPKP